MNGGMTEEAIAQERAAAANDRAAAEHARLDAEDLLRRTEELLRPKPRKGGIAGWVESPKGRFTFAAIATVVDVALAHRAYKRGHIKRAFYFTYGAGDASQRALAAVVELSKEPWA